MEDRYERGLRKLREIDGEQGERIVADLKDIAPDFARYLIEFPFGDIYARPGLDLRTREIATVAALTALGTASPQRSTRLPSRKRPSQSVLATGGRHDGLRRDHHRDRTVRAGAYTAPGGIRHEG